VAVTPRRAPDLARGRTLFERQCAACHGVNGFGDGPAASGLDPAPSNFHDKGRMVQRSLHGLYSTITLGVAGTAMAGYPQLSEDERWALAFHIGGLRDDDKSLQAGREARRSGRVPQEAGTLRAIATLTELDVRERFGAEAAAGFRWLRKNPAAADATREPPIEFARRALADSAEAYRRGADADAQRLALTAYLEGFELVEAVLDTIDLNLRTEVEVQMIAYRDLMRRGAAPDDVARLAARIDGLLAASADKLGNESLSPTTAAVSAFIILLREGLEALLVVAAIIALLVKAGRRDVLPWIHLGWAGALALGFATWVAASTVITLSGAARELTEGITALLAAAILLYVGFWLHDMSHARAWQAYIDRRLHGALARGTLWALAGVSFLAVYREAFETVLFYQALWQQAGEAAHGSIVVGFGAGVVVLAFAAWSILRYGVRLPLGPFFTACAVLMAVLAVTFTGHGVKALQEAGVVPASPFGSINVPLLGLYPTTESTVAQATMVLLVSAAYLWTRTRATGKEAT
jgi:high-affinity iron transporter